MEFDKTRVGWIAAAAAVAGAAAYAYSRAGVRLRFTPANDIALDREVGRVSPQGLATALGVTAALSGIGLWQLMRDKGDSRSSIRETEEIMNIDVPVSVAYNQWTQFEDFPRFMPTVREVRQIDDTHLHWSAIVAGKNVDWDSEIIEQIPDQRIEWRSTSGPRNGGVVTFDKVSEGTTRVTLRMWWQPRSTEERVAGAMGGVKLTTKGNLLRFKQMLEKQGQATGAWRREVPATH